MADGLDADWRTWDKAICEFFVSPTAASLAAVKALLNPNNVLGTGCKVGKHPDCCGLCAANDDCDKLPVHPECRCYRIPTLTSGHITSDGPTLSESPSFGSRQGIKGGPGQG